MIALALTLVLLGGPAQGTVDTVTEIIVHGNHVTTDAEIITLSGLTLGAPFTATTIAEVTARLKAAKKFDDIQVLKRLGSISDPSRIVIVIVVNEGAVRIEIPKDEINPLRVVKRGGFRNLMFMPIFDAEDGYGVTAGVRVAYVGKMGVRNRVSFPLSIGGMRRAGAEIEHTFEGGPLTRVEAGVAIQRQHNPGFDVDDRRRRAWVRADRGFGDLRFSANTGWQRVDFGGRLDNFQSVGAEAVYDTRLDPVFPRNAVYAAVTWDRLFFDSVPGHTNRVKLEGRGYVGLIKQTVLVLRAVRQDADRPLPPYLQPLLGGWSTVRGFEAGSFFGDTLVLGSTELRIPLNSPINIVKLGVSVFYDAGKVYPKGVRFEDEPWREGAGVSGWMTLAAFRLSVGVAHGFGAHTRVSFGGGLTF